MPAATAAGRTSGSASASPTVATVPARNPGSLTRSFRSDICWTNQLLSGGGARLRCTDGPVNVVPSGPRLSAKVVAHGDTKMEARFDTSASCASGHLRTSEVAQPRSACVLLTTLVSA